MRNIEVGIAVFRAEIVGIHRVARGVVSAGAVRVFVESVAVGVGSQEAQIASASLGRYLQPVVAGDLVSFELVDLRKERVGTPNSNAGGAWRAGVDVDQIVQMDTSGSDIGNAECCVGKELALDGQVPLFAVGRSGTRIGGKNR